MPDQELNPESFTNAVGRSAFVGGSSELTPHSFMQGGGVSNELPHPDVAVQMATQNAAIIAQRLIQPTGGDPFGVTAPPLPRQLQTPEQQRTQRANTTSQADDAAFLGGNSPAQAGFGAAVNLDPTGVLPGVARAAGGAKRVATGRDTAERVTGARDMIAGGFEAATPSMAGAAVKGPIKTAVSMAAGIASQEGVEAGLIRLGLSKHWAGLVGDLAGIIAGVGAHEAMSPKARAAIKARVEPILKARAEKANAPEATANSTGTEPYRPADLTPDKYMAAQSAAQEKPNVHQQPVTETPATEKQQAAPARIEAGTDGVAQPGIGQPEAASEVTEAKPVNAPSETSNPVEKTEASPAANLPAGETAPAAAPQPAAGGEDLDTSRVDAEKPEPAKPGATHMGSGFGALQPYYEKMVGSLKESAAEVKALKAKRDAALEAMKRSEITPEEKEHGKTIRQYLTGERDFWGARTNQYIEKLKKLVPDHVDQEALSLMRDFKNRPGELQQFNLGTHPELAKLPADEYQLAMTNLDKIRPSIERALNPTPKMLVADDLLTQIADQSLKEGQKVGFLDSSITSDEYVPHLLHPKGEGETPVPFAERGSALGGKIGRNAGFAKERTIPTLAHAVAYGLKPRTLNAFDAFTIHGDKFATVRATHLLVNEMKGQGVGKWGARAGQGGIPADWTEIAPHAHPFQNTRAFTDTEGNPQIARQTLFVPKFIEEALRPITDPDYSGKIFGFRAVRKFQAVAKAGELGLSLFHLKAENYMALSNMGPKGWAKAQMANRASPEFLVQERDMILHGGTSSIQGRTFEAYKSLQPGSIPTRLDMIRKFPVVKQFDQAAGKLTDLIFDNQMRKFKVTNYALRKASWMMKNPGATPAETSAAMHSITQELNAVYGGLHWENLGVNRMTQQVSRFLMLAPDWTFSNFFNVRTMGEGGMKATEGAHMARAFWLRAIVGGLAVNQGYSLLMSGKPSKNPTMAYLGNDEDGREIYQNVAFAGAPSDLVNLVNNVSRYGLIEGPLKSVTGKAAPGLRVAMEAAFNQDFLGNKITSPDFSLAANSARSAWFLTKGLAPIPFTFTNVVDMAVTGTDDQKATAKEVFGTLLFGQAAKHMAPEGEHWTPLHGLQPNREKPERTFSEQFFQKVR